MTDRVRPVGAVNQPRVGVKNNAPWTQQGVVLRTGLRGDLARDLHQGREIEALAAETDAVADRTGIGPYQIEKALSLIDDDRSGGVGGPEVGQLASIGVR